MVFNVEQQVKRCEKILRANPSDVIAHEILARLRWETGDFERAFSHGAQASISDRAMQETLLITAASAYKLGKTADAQKYAGLALGREPMRLHSQVSWFMGLISRIPFLSTTIKNLQQDVKNSDVHYAELRAWAEQIVVSDERSPGTNQS